MIFVTYNLQLKIDDDICRHLWAEEYQHILRLYKENTKRIDDCRIL